MATFTENIKIKLQGADKAAKGTRKVSSGMKSLAKTAMTAGAAYFGARGIISGLSASIDLYKKQEMAEKKLEAALGKTSIGLLNYAKSLQKVTMFGDEVILEAQAMIASFVKDEKAIKLATKATLDLAAAKGFDLVAAADLVSKTLGSSTNALTRYGIEVVGAVGSTERLESLTTNIAAVFGGQASAQALTYTGRIEQAKNELGDMGETIGKELMPFVANLTEGLVDAVGGLMDFFGLTQDVNDAMRDATVSLEAEKNLLHLNVAALRNENTPRETKARLIKETNIKYGEYVGFLLTEKSSLEDIAKFQNLANQKLITHIQLVANKARIAFEEIEVTESANQVAKDRVQLEDHLIKLGGDKAKLSRMTNRELLTEIDITSAGMKKKTYALVENNKVTVNNQMKIIKFANALKNSDNALKANIDEMNSAIVVNTEYADSLDNIALITGETVTPPAIDLTPYEEFAAAQQVILDKRALEAEQFEEQQGLTDSYIEQNEDKAKSLGLLTSAEIESNKEAEKNLKTQSKKRIEAGKVLTVMTAVTAATGKNAKTVMHLQAAQALVDAWFSSQLAFKNAQLNPIAITNPAYPFIQGGIALAQGLSTAASVAGAIKAEEGMNEIVTEPTLILAGEAGAEYVDIEPTTNEGAGRGGGTVIFQGNIMSQDFIEAEAIPMIKEALRKGGDIGIG